jgi:hypothetical protein
VKQDQKRGVVYQFRIKCARLSSIITVFFQASKLMPACSQCWSFLSLYRGFKFRSCAIELSNRSKTSREASKDHYLAFPSEKRRCCVEIRNVRYRYFDVSSPLFCSMTGIDYISPTKETFNWDRKFKCVLIRSNYFDHTHGHGGTFVSPFRKR